MSALDSDVLKVNAYYVPIGIITVRKAFEDACAGAGMLLFHEHGWFTPMTMEQWLGLPVGKNEDHITHGHIEHIQRVKIPRVSMAVNFKRAEAKEIKPTGENLLKHYGHKDAVTGKPLSRQRLSREHVIPRFRGGGGGWGNLVPMDKDENSRRGHKSYRAAGLKRPKIKPAPRPILPINTLVNTHGYPEWALFEIRTP